MRRYHETFRLWEYLLFTLVTLAVLCLCVCVGSVRIPLSDTLAYFAAELTGGETPVGLVSSILPIRLPRVLCVALTGAALSLAGAAMQGLLKNPLADGSTLGVSSGASLGAVISIAFGITLPGIPLAGTMSMAVTSSTPTVQTQNMTTRACRPEKAYCHRQTLMPWTRAMTGLRAI